MQQFATVWTAGDERIRIQTSPSDQCEEYWYVPNWTSVCVTSANDEWARISIGTFTGYIRRKYLLLDMTKG